MTKKKWSRGIEHGKNQAGMGHENAAKSGGSGAREGGQNRAGTGLTNAAAIVRLRGTGRQPKSGGHGA